MSAAFGNYIGTENGGLIVNSPFAGSIGTLDGLFRVTSTPQLVITGRVPMNPLGTDAIAGSELLTISPPIIIPEGAYLTEVTWMLPGQAFSPAAQEYSFNNLTGVATDLLKVATLGQGVGGTVAASLGGLSAAVQASTNFLAASHFTALGKFINPNANEASAITALGAYTGTDSQRTVQLFSVASGGTTAGSGISALNIPSGFGVSQWIDIPIQIKYWLPPSVNSLSYIRGQIL